MAIYLLKSKHENARNFAGLESALVSAANEAGARVAATAAAKGRNAFPADAYDAIVVADAWATGFTSGDVVFQGAALFSSDRPRGG